MLRDMVLNYIKERLFVIQLKIYVALPYYSVLTLIITILLVIILIENGMIEMVMYFCLSVKSERSLTQRSSLGKSVSKQCYKSMLNSKMMSISL